MIRILFLLIHGIIGLIGIVLIPVACIIAIWIEIALGIKLFLTGMLIRVIWVWVTDNLIVDNEEDE